MGDSHATYIVVVPLSGLHFESFPLSVTPTAEIDNLTAEEADRCLSYGLVLPMLGTTSMARSADCLGFRQRFRLPKIITPPEESYQFAQPGKDHFGARDPLRLHAITDDVFLAFRLVKADPIVARGAVGFHANWANRGGYSIYSRPTAPNMYSNYPMTADDANELRRLWEVLSNASTDKRVPPIALRRFAGASDRWLADDIIVDMVIGAEALFLYDAGSTEDRTELGYRMSLRAAKFIQGSGYSEREVFDIFRRAYKARSTWAHGGEVSTVMLLGRDVDLGEFIPVLRELFRWAFRQALDLVASKSTFGTEYWHRLILP